YYNSSRNEQISQDIGKYERTFALLDSKYKDLIAQLTENEQKERKHNIFMLLATIAMRNGHKKQAKEFTKRAIKQKATLKSIIYLIIYRFNYNTILKFREKIK